MENQYLKLIKRKSCIINKQESFNRRFRRRSFPVPAGRIYAAMAYYSGPYLCHVVSRALGNIYAAVTVRLPVKGSLNASISRGGAKGA